MINKTEFGSFIREKRTEKGLTQKDLAEILFLSESAVSKWEMGKSYPDITLIPDICKALEVSEHELILGANDTEYRKVKKDAELYRKISETFFWVPTAAYAAALLICFICDLCVNKRLTFFPVVAVSLLTAFTFLPTCIRFTDSHKLAVFLGSTFLALTLLFLTCCVRSGGDWFGTAVTGTLLGYAVAFSPLLLKRYLPEDKRKLTLPLYFGICFVCVFLLLVVVNLSYPFSLGRGILILLFAMLCPAVITVMHFVPCGVKFKAAADTFSAGAVLYGAQFCVNGIMGIDTKADYAVNFADWSGNINGNIYLLILIAFTAVSTALLTAGIAEKRKGKDY